MAMNSASSPRAVGRLSVITGRRVPWIALAGLDGRSGFNRSVPHTRQRTASSLSLVPQVGHSFVGFDGVSGISFLRQPHRFSLIGPGLGGLYQKNDGQFDLHRSGGILRRMQPLSLYLHIPFCVHRCAYCDFNTYAGLESLIPNYVNALCQEIRYLAQIAGKKLPVHTIFFGGGTPSLLPYAYIDKVLAQIMEQYAVFEDAEITLEANPGTLSSEYLNSLRQLGVNRLSLGVQSANPGELVLLERQHDYRDVLNSVKWARQAGFDNLSLDMIFGIPYQSVESWKRSLGLVLGLGGDHLSLYALTLEHGTPMQNWVARGLLSEPEQDLAADMYDLAAEFLDRADYSQYEISNWARTGPGQTLRECRHNLQYWRLLPYLGFGAGAHGFVEHTHTVNVLSPAVYIQRMGRGIPEPDGVMGVQENHPGAYPGTPATMSRQTISVTEEMGEVMMMGLRLTREGVSDAEFTRRFGRGLRDVYKAPIEALLQKGLLEWQGDNLRLSPQARLLGNQVFMEFV